MYNITLYLHVFISLLLVITILIQRGRGGGLVEALAGAESLFGTKTSSFLVRSTTILAILFFITSTSLAFLSKRKGRSIFETKPITQQMPQALIDEIATQAEAEPEKPQEAPQAADIKESIEEQTQDAPENLPDAQ